MVRSATDASSPVASSAPICVSGGAAATERAAASSVSVVRPIAETTATTFRPRATSAAVTTAASR